MHNLNAMEHAQALEQGWVDIGKAAQASGVSAKMIRHYETIGLLGGIERTQAGYRIYSAADVHRLRFIRRARALGFSMPQIQELLALWADRSRPSREVKRVAAAHIDALRRKIAEMQSMADTLDRLAASCHGDHRPDCPILDDLQTQAPAIGPASPESAQAAKHALNAKQALNVPMPAGHRRHH